VNLVINFDMPKDKEGYLHRVGRAGRQRTKGTAISFVTSSEDKTLINKLSKDLKANIKLLPEEGDK
jgi:superfamily II DNA/RNA helicase